MRTNMTTFEERCRRQAEQKAVEICRTMGVGWQPFVSFSTPHIHSKSDVRCGAENGRLVIDHTLDGNTRYQVKGRCGGFHTTLHAGFWGSNPAWGFHCVIQELEKLAADYQEGLKEARVTLQQSEVADRINQYGIRP